MLFRSRERERERERGRERESTGGGEGAGPEDLGPAGGDLGPQQPEGVLALHLNYIGL